MASILMLFSAYFQAADIKLRIYMKDGTLQSGNLISENPDTFVLLGKDGRVEVVKDKIMFINGKTLKQWGDRPDKLFQTEIIPSEIPNPAYVNSKDVAVPAIEPVKPLSLGSAPKSESNETPVVKTPVKKNEPIVEKPKPVLDKPKEVVANKEVHSVETPVVSEKKVQETKANIEKPIIADVKNKIAVSEPVVPVVPIVEKKKRKKKIEELAKTEPIENNIAKKASIVTAIASPRKRRLSDKERADFSDIHYQEALVDLQNGNRPEAYKNLFVSRTLNSRNPDPSFMLGKLLLEDQVRERALTYLTHPRLKKNGEAQKLIEQTEANKQLEEKNRNILFGLSGFGLIAWMPVLIIKRKLFKSKPKKKIITAETVEKEIDPKAPQSLFENLNIEKPIEVGSPIPAPVMSKPPVLQKPIEIKKPELLPEVSPPSLVFNKQEPVQAPPKEWLTPKPAPTPPVLPPREIIHPVEPVVLSEPVASSQPAVVSAEESFKIGRQVDRAIQRANDLAGQGKIDLARREYRTCLALDATCADAHLGLGYLCFMEGKFDLALDHYAYALKVNANLAAAHYGVGRIYIEMDREEDAVQELRSSLEIDPTLEEARETLSLLGKAI